MSESLILSVQIFEYDDILYFGVEIFVFQAPEFDENGNIVPASLVFFLIGFVQPRELVCDLFDDVLGNLLHLPVVLQKAARHIERNVGAVDDALQKEQVFGDDLLDIVRNKHLVAVQLDLPAFQLHFIVDFREIQNTL